MVAPCTMQRLPNSCTALNSTELFKIDASGMKIMKLSNRRAANKEAFLGALKKWQASERHCRIGIRKQGMCGHPKKKRPNMYGSLVPMLKGCSKVALSTRSSLPTKSNV